MRIVLETNVIVSRYISPRNAPARIYSYWERGFFDVLTTADILDEFSDVFARPSIRRRMGITAEQVDVIVAEIRNQAILIEPQRFVVGVSIDRDDDMFLECAVAGSADYIVTGDSHLLSLETFRGIPIIPPALFAAILDQIDEP